jgi:uncharacterized membrane protein
MRHLLLMMHLVLIAMGTGMSFSNLVNLRLSLNEQGERFKALGHQRRTIARIGDGVITLIWLTGIVLVAIDDPPVLIANGWFQAKLAFVVLLTVNHFLARRTAGAMAASGDRSLLGRLQIYAGGVWLSAVIAIAMAVLAFPG